MEEEEPWRRARSFPSFFFVVSLLSLFHKVRPLFSLSARIVVRSENTSVENQAKSKLKKTCVCVCVGGGGRGWGEEARKVGEQPSTNKTTWTKNGDVAAFTIPFAIENREKRRRARFWLSALANEWATGDRGLCRITNSLLLSLS